jgi:hypothetical protein
VFVSKFEYLTNKVNTDIVDIKGRINAIDQIIEQNKVTIKEASDALKRSKEELIMSGLQAHLMEICYLKHLFLKISTLNMP